MNSLFNYFLESGATLAVFYLFYWLLLSKRANFQVSRIYLLSSVCFSLILPFIEIAVEQTSNLGNYSEIFLSHILIGSESASASVHLNLSMAVTIVYFLGVLFFAWLFLMQHRRLYSLWKEGEIENYNG